MDQMTLLTWNLQGSHGLDLGLVVDTIEASSPDVIVLQEIQRRQCRRLATRLGWASRWAFKHWPIVSPAEGLAVLTPHRLGRVAPFVLHGSWPWRWQRRIAVDATVVVGARPWRLMNVHLSPHGHVDRRDLELTRVLDRSLMVAPIIAGDLNDRPGGRVARRLERAGWLDAWAVAHSDGRGPWSLGPPDDDVDAGATNWTEGDRTGRQPTQRLDVVFVPARCSVERAEVIDRPLAELAAMSDHLPLLVTVTRSDR